MEESSFSYQQKIAMPYLLLPHAASGRAAVYSSNHRVMAHEASPKLIEFALAHHTLREAWSEEKDKHWGRERPNWAAGGNLEGCTLYWLRDGSSTDEHLKALPKR